MFTVVKGTKLEIPVLFAAFYGLRRSEVVGLKWSAIDFEKNTISITHTFTSCYSNGKRVEVPRDRTKNESSKRTLPLVEPVKKRLLELAKEQKENMRLCGECYCKDYEGYICVNEIGKIIKPDYISETFPKVLEENGLRRIRFHDLRHPYVKHTTKKYNSEKQKTQATKIVDLIAWGFCFCFVCYSKRSWTL